MKTAAVWFTVGLVWMGLPSGARPAAAETVPVGVARVDITPEHPVRLVGYAARQKESEGVAQRIWAKALAIGSSEGDGPAVLIMVENCGVPAAMTDRVAARLEAKAGLKRGRLAVCSTHIHTGPWLAGVLMAHTAAPMPADHLEHINQYSERLTDLLGQVGEQALAARKPAVLSWTQGTVGFAMNRRPIKEGRVTGLGVNPEGAVDHSLPLLRVADPQGKLVAVLLNYACHGTTLGQRHNQIHGDWAGCAQEIFESEHPGATALVCLGCGGDANPAPRDKMEYTTQHGRAMADEVNRLLAGPLKPVSPKLTVQRRQIRLPFDGLPGREELQRRVAAGEAPKATGIEKRQAEHARQTLAQLERGPLPTGIDYPVTTWTFGDDLGMVFLPGEVVADYALRLKRELDGSRLWVTAYANGLPGYIVSRHMFAEGGYEPDYAVMVYGLPAPLAPTVEDQIIETVKSLLPAGYAAGR
jgi:neutral ceramidase